MLFQSQTLLNWFSLFESKLIYRKFLLDLDPRGLYYKTFYGHNFRKKLVFVLGNPFQHILMFACKAGAYLSEVPFGFQVLHSRVSLGSWPHPQTQGWKGLQRTTL
jgi:hypothetical protein